MRNPREIRMSQWRSWGLLFALWLGAAGSALAQNAIQSINSSQQAGSDVIRIELTEPLTAVPAGFTVQTPPRIAIDLPGIGNALGKSSVEINQGNLRSVSIAQSGDRTRLVLNLKAPAGYKAVIDGKSLVVSLDNNAPATLASSSGQTTRFAESLNRTQLSLRDIDFRRGRNGEGRIVVDLSDTTTGIDIRQQGKTLIVDFIKTSLPRNLERRLDVGDFATPVMTIDTFEQAGNTRMVIEPKGLWEHSAYQTDNRFTIEVKPIQEDPNRLTQGTRAGYKGEKLSLNFQNVEVRAVLQVIADFTGLNIITSDTVTGSLTLRLKDIPWDQALDIIMQTKGLDMRKNGNVVLIAPREELAVKEKQQLESLQQINDLEPLQTEMFQLNYQKADAIKALLSDKEGKFLSKRGTAVVDARTNILFVQDTGGRLEEVRRLIRQIDVTVRQVVIESRIVIADDKFSRQLGVRFGMQTGFTLNKRYAGGIGGSLNTQPVVSTSGGTTTTRETRTQTPFELASGLASAGYSDSPQLNVNLPVTNPAGQLALTLINLGSGNLINLELSALEADSRGKVVSSPRVVTADNQKASIEQGTEIPYVTPGTGNSPATVQFKKAVLRLDVTPQITPDNRIIMTVEIRKDSVGQFVPVAGGGFVPAIDTKNVITQIAVNNGDTAVIAGIYEETLNNDVTKIPFLGDLPYLGYLFKTTNKNIEKTELLIFLTPRIVKESVTAVR